VPLVDIDVVDVVAASVVTEDAAGACTGDATVGSAESGLAAGVMLPPLHAARAIRAIGKKRCTLERI
jgi:hypothetical protein